jgi:hypothetical protein
VTPGVALRSRTQGPDERRRNRGDRRTPDRGRLRDEALGRRRALVGVLSGATGQGSSDPRSACFRFQAMMLRGGVTKMPRQFQARLASFPRASSASNASAADEPAATARTRAIFGGTSVAHADRGTWTWRDQRIAGRPPPPARAAPFNSPVPRAFGAHCRDCSASAPIGAEPARASIPPARRDRPRPPARAAPFRSPARRASGAQGRDCSASPPIGAEPARASTIQSSSCIVVPVIIPPRNPAHPKSRPAMSDVHLEDILALARP